MAALFRFPRWLWQILWGIAFLVPFSLYAARFGATYVLSQIGQPLRAKIEVLDVRPDELGWLTLQSAPESAYENSSMRFSSVAQDIKTTIERTPNGRVVAWLTTTKPIKEEFVDLLLTLNWSTGRMTEALTLLIPHHEVAMLEDNVVVPLANSPEDNKSTGDVSVIDESQLRNNSTDSGNGSESQGRLPEGLGKQQVGPVDSHKAGRSARAATGKGYKVRRGDTLAKIAQQMRQADSDLQHATLDQLLWAIYQGNPDAFVANNVNRLKAGVVLVEPSVEQTTATDHDEARRQIIAQGQEFEQYRSTLAAVAPSSRESADARSSSGGVSATVEDKAAAKVEDELHLSRTESQQQEETKIASDNAVREAQARVDQLEKHVADLRQLADLTGTSNTAGVSSASEPADGPNVPLVSANKSAEKTNAIARMVAKVQSFFSHNPAAPLGILLGFLVVGTILLRRRARAKPLFPEYREQQEVPASAKKIFADLNLDLEPQVKEPPPVKAKAAPAVVAQTNTEEPSQIENSAESMQVRLKLAQAYVDLGDKSGACKLLEEVLEHGSPPQRKQAQVLLSTLN